MINDIDAVWSGDVTLLLIQNGKEQIVHKKKVQADALELGSVEFEVALPTDGDSFQLVAEIRGSDGKPVRSYRDLRVIK